MGNLSLHFTAYPVGGPAYAFPNACEYKCFSDEAFHQSVRQLKTCGEQASKERKAFDECSTIILSNRHTFCYVDCVWFLLN